MGTGEIINQMDGHGINHLSDEWARDESFIRCDGHGISHFSD